MKGHDVLLNEVYSSESMILEAATRLRKMLITKQTFYTVQHPHGLRLTFVKLHEGHS